MGFTLHKRAFRDVVFLRYGWTPPFLPTNCICGKAFSVEHALSFNRGDFPIHHHNEICNLTAELLTQVCHNVCLEPSLQKLDNEHFQLWTANADDNERLYISADGFWERSERAFFDVRVFNPFALTNLKHQLGSCYHLHEMEKRRQYDEHVQEVERGSFAPLVFATSGGMGKQATVLYKRLASLLALKKDQPYSHVIGLIWSRLAFSLLSPFGFLSSSILHHLPVGYMVHCRIRPQSHLSQYPGPHNQWGSGGCVINYVQYNLLTLSICMFLLETMPAICPMYISIIFCVLYT